MMMMMKPEDNNNIILMVDDAQEVEWQSPIGDEMLCLSWRALWLKEIWYENDDPKPNRKC